MNQCLFDLFTNPDKRGRLASGLPTAFEIVRQQMPKSNPAVGILREHVITGFLISEFGESKVKVPESGVERGFDLEVCGHGLSVKTQTGQGPFKILWTADTEQATREAEGDYIPTHDMLLINIFWEQVKESVFYIPLHVQKNIFSQLGARNYLQVKTGTNHRGVELRSKAATKLKSHPDTLRISVNWITESIVYPKPWKQWEDFWNQL